MSSNSANVQLKLSNTNLCAPGILAEVHRRRSSARSGIDVPNENTLLTDGQRKISSVNLCAPGLLGEHLNRRRSSARSALDLPNETCAVCRGHRNSTASSLSHVSVHCTDNAKASVIIATAPAAASISSHSPALPALCHLVMRHQYKTYPQRWFVLATVCLLALSNATQWISFAPLHDATDAFYCRGSGTDHSSAHQNSSAPLPPHRNESKDQCDVEYWTSQIFQIVGVLTGIFGMYITDRYGIRISNVPEVVWRNRAKDANSKAARC
ncbi:major facilitator superfamily domain-containing protein 7-b [Ditylenchus destructor]|uniref:Major facilitator superfamily domain-containing protein 7-b n=1 Tax=Ditylenchus destructor TaxID=166010 RepID=A0AAD4QZ28_9BILA|nr:major facilitator superfamily domain-containing protein 7-b [Ditylenchus destructor]